MRPRSTYVRYYEILEVPIGAPMAEIERSFRELIKVWHPDRFVDNPSLQIRATRKTSEITKAFQWIRRHEKFLADEDPATSSPERILLALRQSLGHYVSRHPATSTEMVERALRGLLAEVVQRRQKPRPSPLDALSTWKWISLSQVWTHIVRHRKVAFAWSVMIILFLAFGAR